MTQVPIAAASDADPRLAQLRETLVRGLALMDELKPHSIAGARLQQIIDELDDMFGAGGGVQA